MVGREMLLKAQGQFKWLHTDEFALPTIYWQNEDKLKKISQIICRFEEDKDYVYLGATLKQ